MSVMVMVDCCKHSSIKKILPKSITIKMRKCSYAPNQHVQGLVEKVLPYGVFVLLADGSQAYIRRREMSWEGDIDPRDLTKVGQTLKAAILNPSPDGPRVELSLRPLLPDPWDQFSKQFRVGDIIKGQVKDILSHGIYVEIVPGVDGYVPLAELATWSPAKPNEIVWIDDHIEAIITYINSNNDKRFIKLSMRRRLKQLSLASSFMDKLTKDNPMSETVSVDEENIAALHLEVSDIEAIGRILILEDQDNLRHSLAKWLRQFNCIVDSAASKREAIEKIATESIGVCFVDIDLPDGDGLSFVKVLREYQPNVHVFIMSISDWLVERIEEIEALGVTAVLLKPLDLKEIDSLLRKIGKGQKLQKIKHLSAARRKRPENAFEKLSHTMRANSSLPQRLQDSLEQLLELTKAEVAILFHMDPATQLISVAASAGAISLINEQETYALIDSPVKDVIDEKDLILVKQVSAESASRYQKLQAFLPFEAAIGAPIQGSGGTEYALFIFHRRPRVFSHFRLRDVQAVTVLLAAALENQELVGKIEAISNVLLSGQLAASLGHEVFNKISALEIQLLNLHADFNRIVMKNSADSILLDLQEPGQALDDIIQTAADLKNAANLFQSLMRSEAFQKIDIDHVILQARMQLLPLLNRNKVNLNLVQTSNLPMISISPTHLRQVILNLLLNAIQHLSVRSNGSRDITIKTSYEQADTKRPIKIRIADTGPGIHRNLWDTIFNLGFSTREKGSGLGLYIARSLIEHIGGAICVEESAIPIGTTFLIELPILIEGGQDGSRSHTSINC